MKKAKRKPLQRINDGFPVPRVYRRKARGKKSARLLIKCGDCDQKFEIHYGPEGEDLEIAGVLASIETWRAILFPLLKKPVRRKLQYRSLEEYLAERTKRNR